MKRMCTSCQLPRVAQNIPVTSCMPVNTCPPKEDKFPVGHSYVPMQEWKDLFSPSVALHKGTLFSQLDLPFLATCCPPERRMK